MTIRKEWRNLSKAQQNKFLDALLRLMDSPAKSGPHSYHSRSSDLQALHRGMTNTAYADIFTMSYVSVYCRSIATANYSRKGQPWHCYYMHTYETLLRDKCSYTGSIP